ncbi:glycosyltransferase [Synechococcus sp. AH-736-G21]|nr:glycosyltransferase [Synechococcus sp. AH-736-G21]
MKSHHLYLEALKAFIANDFEKSYAHLCDLSKHSDFLSALDQEVMDWLMYSCQENIKNKSTDSIDSYAIPYDQQKSLIHEKCAFDSSYYLTTYPDVQDGKFDPLEHFLRFGWKEKRSPHPHFFPDIFSKFISTTDSTVGVSTNPLVAYLENTPANFPADYTGAFRYFEYLSGFNKSFFRSSSKFSSPLPDEGEISVAVCIHAFFEDSAFLILKSLSCLPFQYDLYLTTDTIEKANKLLDAASDCRVSTRVFILPNEGRDLAPFFQTFSNISTSGKSYDFYLKLHAKQSVDSSRKHKGLGDSWLKFILDSLLGSKENVRYILSRLSSENSDQLIAPLCYPELYPYCSWGDNIKYVNHLQYKYSFSGQQIDQCFDFPAGSMYWASHQAVESLFNAFEFSRIPLEPIGRNGSYLHAFERLVPYILSSKGFSSAYHFNCTSRPLSCLLPVNIARPSGILNFSQICEWRVSFVRKLVNQLLQTSVSRLEFPIHDDPQLSIVIPIYNNYEITLQCLVSLYLIRNELDFEILIIDDCSPDFASDYLKDISGLTIHRNEVNLGFVGTCNEGASMARARSLLFLNNDTIVLDDALSTLLSALSDPDVGLVGSKLLYEDGSLQEAGGCIWFDGGALNYGRYDNPCNPFYCYDRPVDYLSGASIAITRELFFSVGGFDTLYSPGYYEDTDLAMKVREAGLSVHYVHRSNVIHLEGKSSINENEGMKRFQAINKKKFKDKWSTQLSSGNFLKPNQLSYYYDRMCIKSILFLDSYLPTPDKDSGSNDIFIAMKLCRKLGFQVIFIPTVEIGCDYKYLDGLRDSGIITYFDDGNSHPFYAVKKIANRISHCFISRYDNWHRFYEIILSENPAINFIFDTVDLHYLRQEREAELQDSESLHLQAAHVKDAELAAIRQAPSVLLRSTVEIDILQREVEKNVNLVHFPICRDVESSIPGYADRSGVVFVGGFRHAPNIDSVIYFLNEIYPIIRSDDQDIVINIVGSHQELLLSELKGVVPGLSNVNFLGYVPDVTSLLDSSRLAIAPLRFGAGTKGKVVSSLCRGLPCISSSVAVEGLPGLPLHDLYLANEPKLFAELVIRLYHDPVLWCQCSEALLSYAVDNCSVKKMKEVLTSLLFPVVGPISC